MSGKDRILARIRRAVPDRAPGGPGPGRDPGTDPDPYGGIPRDYLQVHGVRTPAETVDLLAANLTEYRAKVHRVDEDSIALLLMRLLAERGAESILVPPALPPHWLAAAGPTRIHDRAARTPYELDAADSVVTGCALAIAETGTIVLDGSPDQGRRRITLIPDHHI